MQQIAVIVLLLVLAFAAPVTSAGDDPAKERHEMMENMGEAAKTLGGMLKGETAFDAALVMDSFSTMQEIGSLVVTLFPEGSYVGEPDTAAEGVWTDRAGFDAAMFNFVSAVDAAVEASPQSLDELKLVSSDVFKGCKACHEEYRIPGD